MQLDTCPNCGKLCMTYEQASSLVHKLKKEQRTKKMHKVPLRQYKCEHCKAWHVTSRRPYDWHETDKSNGGKRWKKHGGLF